MQSIAEGQIVPVANKRRATATHNQVEPYGPNLEFNKLISPGRGKKEDLNYAIDIGKILRILDSRDPGKINKITLAAKAIQGNTQTVGLWDTLFNATQWRPSTAAVFVADANYQPIPKSRVVSTSHFLDYAHANTRSHLNRLAAGDIVGIAISDGIKGNTHVLLYRVEDAVLLRVKVEDGDSDVVLMPGVNVSLEHRLVLDHNDHGKAQMFTIGDGPYTQEVQGSFVAWLVDTVYDIPNGYAWKPHFLPFQPRDYQRAKTEARLTEQMPQALEITFAMFEEECRETYREAKKDQPPRDKPQQHGQGNMRRRPKARQGPILPVVEIVSVDQTFYALMPGDDRMVKFTFEEGDHQLITERHLTNQDLEGVLVDETTTVMRLSDSFGEKAYLRYFTINY